MKKQLLVFFPFIILIIAGCKKENELKKSVFVYDTESPDLPAYSEWGYNTFGAYYDREPFISNNAVVPAKILVLNNNTSIVLDGQKGPASYYSYSEMSLTIKINGFVPNVYSDLLALNDTILDLSDPAYEVIVSVDTAVYVAAIIHGTFEVNRAQNLLVDNKQVEVILSGHFEFQALINNKPITVSEGRFDVGIGTDNFYKF